MPRDKKLRDVLDSLSDEPAKALPAPDRELMESVLRRLKIQESRRLAQYQQPEPAEEDLTEQELEALRARQQQDAEEMQRLQEERERLLETQRELEDRLARLEAASHGGPLSYVDEPETVEFSRVDLDAGEEELLEFQYLGDGGQDIGRTDGDAWEEPAPAATQWGDWPETSDQRAAVQWDEDEEDWSAPAPEPRPEPSWEEPEQDWPREPGTEEAAPPWSQPQQEPWEGDEDPAQWPGPTEPAPAEPTPPPGHESIEELDDRTRAELEELESQLAELEREIEKRSGSEPAKDEEETA